MDNEGTSSYVIRREQQNRADQQREYRERERIAFCNLLAALREVELTNRCSRCEVLRKAAECLKSLWEEQVNLQQRLWELTGNMTGENILKPGVNLQPWLGELTGNVAGADIPQSRALELVFDQDLELLEFQFLLAQLEFGGQGMDAGGPSYGGWP